MEHIDGEDVLGVVQAPAGLANQIDVYGILVPSPGIAEFEIITTADPSRVIVAIPYAEMPSIEMNRPVRAAWAAAVEEVFMRSAAVLGQWLTQHPDHGAS